MESKKTCQQSFRASNPYLTDNHYLYHIDLSTTDKLSLRFADVKFVCMGGKSLRMRKFAELMYDELGRPSNSELEEKPTQGYRLKDISASGGRYSMFKAGPVISINHGIGMASLSVVLHEILKLIHFAGCTNVKFFRLGTSGGLGVEPGTVVVTEKSYDGLLENCFKQVACGKEHRYNCNPDPGLTKELLEGAKHDDVTAVAGNTIATNDFFEEQGRLDGAFCSFTPEEQSEFLHRAYDEFGIRNMEMESTCFAAMCNRAGVKCAIVCVVAVNRLERDDVTSDLKLLASWDMAPQRLVAGYIRRNQKDLSCLGA